MMFWKRREGAKPTRGGSPLGRLESALMDLLWTRQELSVKDVLPERSVLTLSVRRDSSCGTSLRGGAPGRANYDLW